MSGAPYVAQVSRRSARCAAVGVEREQLAHEVDRQMHRRADEEQDSGDDHGDVKTSFVAPEDEDVQTSEERDHEHTFA